MTADNSWAEDTGLHPVVPAATKKETMKPTGKKGAVTVFKMLRVNPWSGTYLAVGLPLLVGLMLLLAGSVTLAVTDYGAQNLINFYRFNSIHSVLVPLGFALAMGVSVYRGTCLVLGMGVSRWSYLGGVLLMAAYISGLAALVYCAFALLENLTFGYGVGWHVMGAGVKESSMVFPEQYSLRSTAIDYLEFTEHKFLLFLTLQVFAVLIALVALRFSLLSGALTSLLLPLYLVLVQRYTLTSTRRDLGLWYLLQPYWLDDQGQRHFYDSGYDYLVGGYYLPDGTEVVEVVESTFDIVLYRLQDFGPAILVLLILVALTWRRTSLR